MIGNLTDQVMEEIQRLTRLQGEGKDVGNQIAELEALVLRAKEEPDVEEEQEYWQSKDYTAWQGASS